MATLAVQPRGVDACLDLCQPILTAVLVLLTGSTREIIPVELLYWSIRVLELKSEPDVQICTAGSDSSGC